MDAHSSFRDVLIQSGHLIPTGIDGLYGRGRIFEEIVSGLEAQVTAAGGQDGAEVMRFPPAISRHDFEISGYMKSFPDLAGTIHSFCGDERAHQRLICEMVDGTDWTAQQKATDLVMTPAACYPLYPVVARRGNLPPEGHLVDVYSYCFRHEPSLDPARMQMFRQREYVRLGTADQVLEFREIWLRRGREIVERLLLPMEIDIANDPFFGRAGRLMSDAQREQRLKFELLVPVNDPTKPTACVSFNYHMDHFGEAWGLHDSEGQLAHTACVGFGMERLTLALLRHHGTDISDWPDELRTLFWGNA